MTRPLAAPRRHRAAWLAGLLIAAALVPAFSGPVMAGTSEPQDVTGMIFFRIPFGDPRLRKRAPEVGFHLDIADPKLKDYEQRRFDSDSGRWLPRFDMEKVQTWPLNPPKPRSAETAEPARHR